MASRWLAAYLQATTTRQKPVAASERTNQVIVNNANCLVQAQLVLAGGARCRTVNPVVSYSPVRSACPFSASVTWPASPLCCLQKRALFCGEACVQGATNAMIAIQQYSGSAANTRWMSRATTKSTAGRASRYSWLRASRVLLSYCHCASGPALRRGYAHIFPRGTYRLAHLGAVRPPSAAALRSLYLLVASYPSR